MSHHMTKIPKFSVREFSADRMHSFQVPLVTEVLTEESAPTVQEMEVIVPVNEHQVQPEQDEYCDPSVATNPWTAVRSKLLDVYFDESITKCAACKGEMGHFHIRCQDCGSQTYYCSQDCCKLYHRWDLNPFHKPMQWMVSTFMYLDRSQNKMELEIILLIWEIACKPFGKITHIHL